jgi:hypothetical protein
MVVKDNVCSITVTEEEKQALIGRSVRNYVS